MGVGANQDISVGGNRGITVTGTDTLGVTGTRTTNVTGAVTEKYETGDTKTIAAAGYTETITAHRHLDRDRHLHLQPHRRWAGHRDPAGRA
ncbi:hypothetical protein G6F64_014800 [Rhizopus arrhizus]|uniref:Uncharacterized protein n=1 Tax=Rhizopus oryzae TaxID=64495 RepID=A0A9P6WST6_RHIOR|nr:hypothetical protein G6F64_014800 [Rhizopus arrhizus]